MTNNPSPEHKKRLNAILDALGRPLRATKDFLFAVPEDVPLGDTLASVWEAPGGVWTMLEAVGEHIEALRRHLVRALLVLLITTLASFLYAQDIMKMLAVPLGEPPKTAAVTGTAMWWAGMMAQGADGLSKLQVIEPTEAVGVFMRVALLSGVTLAMPWIILEVFLFVAPGLMPRSRWVLLIGIPIASLFFLLGLIFCYFFMLPSAIPFLYQFMGFKAAWRPSAYFGLLTNLEFWTGVTFEMPLAAYLAAAAGMVRARQLAGGWRVAIVVIAAAAAVITPTTDPVNMLLVMAPMILLYGISILAAAIAARRW
jgi:sec-independent protein translocase protein TatC